MVRDMTQRKKVETALISSRERFNKAFRASPAPTLISTITDGCYLDVNNSALTLLGYTREEMLNHTVEELSIWENYDDRAPLVARLIKEGSIKDELITIRNKNGERKETLWSCEIIQLNNEDVMLSLLLDITDRKRIEEALRASEQRLMEIIDFLPIATMAIDRKGSIIAWNRAMEEMTGVKAKDMMGKGDYEYALPFYGKRRPIMLDLILKPDKEYERQYGIIIQKQNDLLVAESEVPFLKGERAFLWGKASPLNDSTGNIVGAIESLIDITARRRQDTILKSREKELALKTEELQDLNAALRVLLRQKEDDRKELEGTIVSNVKLLIQPYIDMLKHHTNSKGLAYVDILESNLNDIVSPFIQKLSLKCLNLTNKEMQIANLIKEEKTTKEISEILNISESSINVHRYHIRKKLGLTSTQNLRFYLSSLS